MDSVNITSCLSSINSPSILASTPPPPTAAVLVPLSNNQTPPPPPPQIETPTKHPNPDLRLPPNPNPNPPTDLKSFTCFNKMPTELRLKVWRTAAHTPRTIDLWSRHVKGAAAQLMDEAEVRPEHRPVLWTSHNGVPALLSVCKEARDEGLRFYELAFGTDAWAVDTRRNRRQAMATAPVYSYSSSNLVVAVVSPPKIYVNWAVDVICPVRQLGGGDMEMMLQQPGRRKIHPSWAEACLKHPKMRRVALDICQRDAQQHILHAGSLEELIIYHSNDALERDDVEKEHPITLSFGSSGLKKKGKKTAGGNNCGCGVMDAWLDQMQKLLKYHFELTEDGRWRHRPAAQSRGFDCQRVDSRVINYGRGVAEQPAGWKPPVILTTMVEVMIDGKVV